MKDVKAFKLKTGESFIAEVLDTNNTDGGRVYDINNPVFPVNQPDGTIAFAPWNPLFALRQFSIHRTDLIVGPDEVLPEILQHYNTMFSTILTPPPKGLILG